MRTRRFTTRQRLFILCVLLLVVFLILRILGVDSLLLYIAILLTSSGGIAIGVIDGRKSPPR